MNLHHSLDAASRAAEIRELALGFFDGVHLGHQEVLRGPRSPQELQHSALLSFQQHPQSILSPAKKIILITGQPHKLRLLKALGLHHVILLPFNLEVSRQSALDFLESLRAAFPKLRSIRVGQNFHFGHQRQGNPDFLQSWAQKFGITAQVIPSLKSQDQIISSSLIRRQLEMGDCSAAASLLGRPYSLWGTVMPGQHLGSQLGFPTANLQTEDGILLPLGVYAGQALLPSGRSYAAAINIGLRPTLGPNNTTLPSVEAHLLDFSENLYDSEIELIPQRFLRPEQRFENLDALKAQIQLDVKLTREA
ncbi:MAG: bifunctional riboflavin kinase/FAD synthetase [Blastochloris sp.]|nr:bifunctional riboflavin kinase/FAD synthetase [Blastochloris sp.]